MTDAACDMTLDELIARFYDADCTEAIAGDLAGRLREDAEARAAFLAVSRVGVLLGEMSVDVIAMPDEEPPATLIVGDSLRGVRFGAAWIRRASYAFAAALLLTAAAAAIYIVVFDSKPETRNPKPDSAPVATVTDTADGGTLIANDDAVAPGQSMHSGPVWLDQGAADFQLTNGVGVALRGKTQLTVHDPMHATLTHGSASFDCPPRAKGYTVYLPHDARVVDLGTHFRVDLTGDAGLVTVVEGRVAIEQHSGRMELVGGQRAVSTGGGRWSVQLAEWATDQPFDTQLAGRSYGNLAALTATGLGAGLVAQPPLTKGLFDPTQTGAGVMVVRPRHETALVDDRIASAIAKQQYVEVTATVDGLSEGQTLEIDRLHYSVQANMGSPPPDARFGPRVVQAAIAIDADPFDESDLLGEAVRLTPDAEGIWAAQVRIEHGFPRGLTNGDRVRIRIYLAGGKTLGSGAPWNAATRIGTIQLFGRVHGADRPAQPTDPTDPSDADVRLRSDKPAAERRRADAETSQ